MRRFLGAVAMMGMVGVAAIGLWAGVGRAAGPAPVSPLADRVVVLPATLTAADVAPASEPTPVVARVDAVVPAAVVEPAATATVEPAVAAAEPAAASVVVSCGTGPEGAFVEVASAAECPGSAAVRIEATTNA